MIFEKVRNNEFMRLVRSTGNVSVQNHLSKNNNN